LPVRFDPLVRLKETQYKSHLFTVTSSLQAYLEGSVAGQTIYVRDGWTDHDRRIWMH
jgi:hypothetical protein